MSWSVAKALAVTVGSRVPGFVTLRPSFNDDVCSAAAVSSGYGSCHRTCESYVQPYPNPCCSASCINSTRRVYGGSGRTVTPKLNIARSLRPPPIQARRDLQLVRPAARRLSLEVADRGDDVLFGRRRLRGPALERTGRLRALDRRVDDQKRCVDADLPQLEGNRLR